MTHHKISSLKFSRPNKNSNLKRI